MTLSKAKNMPKNNQKRIKKTRKGWANSERTPKKGKEKCLSTEMTRSRSQTSISSIGSMDSIEFILQAGKEI